MQHILVFLIVSLVILLEPLYAHAWGKRGHSIVCQTAASLASRTPSGDFLKSHSFDLGYYCNVPDLVWKKPGLYEIEWTNHFMDLEIFERAFSGQESLNPFELDRLTFNSKFPNVADNAGRAYWRVQELMAALEGIAGKLKQKDLSKDDRHRLQADWLLHAGAIGHYVGDLGQPLHVTENYDGQLSNQKGIHAFFEDDVVDLLFEGRGKASKQLEGEVMRRANQKWPPKGNAAASKLPLKILEELTRASHKKLPKLLALDKKIGRDDKLKAASAYHDMITDRMAAAAVALAQLWSQRLGWEYDGKRFYTFYGTPEFISPPKAAPSTTPTGTPAPK